MQHIPTPKTIKFNKETESKGEFIIEPLYPGYGITLGNALRRVLLSSLPGSAISSVKIKGIEHEFSTINYTKEDVVDILLNIKQIKLKIDGELNQEEPLVIKLKKTGEGKVTAGDFKCPTQVSIANKGLLIATLTDKAADLEIECVVQKGRGYLPTENRPGEKLEIGHISVDAIFTPINHVNIQVEHVRVGEMTNWDKLILTLETNGTLSCEQAFGLAVDILCDQFNSLTKKEEKETPTKKEVEKSAAQKKEEVTTTKEPTLEEKTEEKKPEPADQSLAQSHALSTHIEQASEAGEDKPKRKRGRPRKES